MREEVKSCNSSLIQTSARPVEARWLNVVLLAVAVAGWMIFVVACVSGPAWSPDGSKILFGYYDEANSRDVIAMYDRRTHKTRNLYVQLISEDQKDDDFIVAPAWQADGTRAIVGVSTGAGDSGPHCVLVSISINPMEPLQTYNFGSKGICYTAGMMPQLADQVYLGGDDGLAWMNPSTGNMDGKRFDGGAGFISKHDGRLVYIRQAKRSAANAKDKDDTEQGVEIGQIDLQDVTLKPFFVLWGKQYEDLGFDDDTLGGTWEPGGRRLAIVGSGEVSDWINMLDEKKGVIGKITPDIGSKNFRLGPIVWSHDGKTLYAPAIIKGEKEKTYTYSLAEIPLSGMTGSLTRIADFDKESMSDGDVWSMLNLGLQVSLSPDGRTIAASTGAIGNRAAIADRGLFLIDVAHPEHRITRIPAPKNPKVH